MNENDLKHYERAHEKAIEKIQKVEGPHGNVDTFLLFKWQNLNTFMPKQSDKRLG